MIAEQGDWPFAGADSANVPVDVWLTPIDEDDRAQCNIDGIPPDHKWSLTASNYMPRKCIVGEGAYAATAPTRDALREIVTERIIPLYRDALAGLQAIADGTSGYLYYWDPPPPNRRTTMDKLEPTAWMVDEPGGRRVPWLVIEQGGMEEFIRQWRQSGFPGARATPLFAIPPGWELVESAEPASLRNHCGGKPDAC